MTDPPPPPEPRWQSSGAPPPPPPPWQSPGGQPSGQDWQPAPTWHRGPSMPPKGVNPDGSPRGQPGLWAAILCVGLVVFTLAAVFVVRSFTTTFGRGQEVVAPATETMHLDSGSWRVYVERQTVGAGVEISGPDGQVALQPQPFGTTETLTIGSRSYRAVQRFEISNAGDYTVVASGAGRIRIGRSVFHVVSEWRWMLGGAASVPAIIVGIVMTTITVRNRGRARTYQATLDDGANRPV